MGCIGLNIHVVKREIGQGCQRKIEAIFVSFLLSLYCMEIEKQGDWSEQYQYQKRDKKHFCKHNKGNTEIMGKYEEDREKALSNISITQQIARIKEQYNAGF